MRDLYVLRRTVKPYDIVAIADDFDRVSMEMVRFSRDDQRNMVVENHDLLEDGD